jgi:hypothetical protein
MSVSPAEWAYEFEGVEYFKEISSILRKYGSELDDDKSFSEFRNGVYDTCLKALETLINEGFFGEKQNGLIN